MPKVAEGRTQVATVIDDALLARLDACAKVLGWSRSQLMAELLQDAINDNEDAIMWAVKAVKVKKNIQRGFKSLLEIILLKGEADKNAPAQR